MTDKKPKRITEIIIDDQAMYEIRDIAYKMWVSMSHQVSIDHIRFRALELYLLKNNVKPKFKVKL